MRELKFRVWLHNSKEWGNVACLEIFNATGKLEYLYQDQPYTIQQYIGLKDKNNVEIYEGDILKWHPGDSNLSEVIFQNGSFFAKGINWSGHWYLGDYNNNFEMDFEIIGNIFENSELLK